MHGGVQFVDVEVRLPDSHVVIVSYRLHPPIASCLLEGASVQSLSDRSNIFYAISKPPYLHSHSLGSG